ncbi:hypothetical protein BDV28DRAFT_159398 [Aspergillus coremiiformis]|uniref:VIP1 N-terminal domain-containing protein n=1 Tax=Aspergillus coremiiformis TaxID=138285 RepID=A0A5N6Z171_9EURO|nr:hypothetical protein BDV28DRAFT_159398 [Aspergillus coremiiformis]
MSTRYKLTAVTKRPEINGNDNPTPVLTPRTEDIDRRHRPSPTYSTRATSSETCRPPVHIMRPPWRLGICAMQDKALSKPNQEIFRRLQVDGLIDVALFSEKTLLTKAPKDWPACDFLIAFYSDGFPLEKAVAYTQLRTPFCYNDLRMQSVLFDRRLCNRVLDYLGDGNTLFVDGRTLHKPFVEKPVNAEDHNIYIYFPQTPQRPGGGRRLFRKVDNKCSEYDANLVVPRCLTEQGTTSYVYEPLLNADNDEDVKAYAVGPRYCLAVRRKSPAVTGVVHQDASGREVRLLTEVSREEAEAASRISRGFGQSVCGFDIVRHTGKSYVIDVNGWTSVKNQPASFYGQCADLLQQMLLSHVAHTIAQS